MSTTHIQTNSLPRTSVAGQGQFAEILNKDLCGAENVVGALRWLNQGDGYAAQPLADTHQLLYLMEGEGVIELDSKSYDLKKGCGIYLGPQETAKITQRGAGVLKLFHLIVPHKEDQ